MSAPATFDVLSEYVYNEADPARVSDDDFKPYIVYWSGHAAVGKLLLKGNAVATSEQLVELFSSLPVHRRPLAIVLGACHTMLASQELAMQRCASLCVGFSGPVSDKAMVYWGKAFNYILKLAPALPPELLLEPAPDQPVPSLRDLLFHTGTLAALLVEADPASPVTRDNIAELCMQCHGWYRNLLAEETAALPSADTALRRMLQPEFDRGANNGWGCIILDHLQLQVELERKKNERVEQMKVVSAALEELSHLKSAFGHVITQAELQEVEEFDDDTKGMSPAPV